MQWRSGANPGRLREGGGKFVILYIVVRQKTAASPHSAVLYRSSLPPSNPSGALLLRTLTYVQLGFFVTRSAWPISANWAYLAGLTYLISPLGFRKSAAKLFRLCGQNFNKFVSTSLFPARPTCLVSLTITKTFAPVALGVPHALAGLKNSRLAACFWKRFSFLEIVLPLGPPKKAAWRLYIE